MALAHYFRPDQFAYRQFRHLRRPELVAHEMRPPTDLYGQEPPAKYVAVREFPVFGFDIGAMLALQSPN